MKFSKVDHTRSAVGIQKATDSVHGMLYTDPKKQEVNDLDKRFDQLNVKAKRLYNVFNQSKAGEDDEKGFGSLVKGLNMELKNLLFLRNAKEDRFGNIRYDYGVKSKPVEIVSNLGMIESLKGERDPQKAISKLLLLYLRKGLKPGTDGLRMILEASCGLRKLSGEEKELKVFLETLDEDFEKKTFKKNLIRSIENQNMAVQPSNEGDPIIGITQGRFNSQKNEEKSAIERMMSMYADLNEDHREDVLRKLRRLNVLYFNVDTEKTEEPTLPGEVDTNPVFEVWHDHEKGKENDRQFATFAKILTEDRETRKKEKLAVKEALNDLKSAIRDHNIMAYRCSIKVTEQDKDGLFFEDQRINRFWIHHIESAVERILASINPDKLYKLRIGYLGEKVWKDLLNYLSIKYIAVGKAVFHFAMEDLGKTGQDIELGKLSNRVSGGLTSFDYEQIRADETLQRQLSVEVAFAANNLFRAVVGQTGKKIKQSKSEENEEDFLLWNAEKIAKSIKKEGEGNTLKSILQFFGGASGWDLNQFCAAYSNEPSNYGYETRLADDLRKAIYSLRNETFHFTTLNKGSFDWNAKLIGDMFSHEAATGIAVERTRFYSNNLPMFYRESDLKRIMDHLYNTYHPRASQVPSFNSVFVRKNFRLFLSNTLNTNTSFDTEVSQKWESGVYYLFKEIYYNSFLPSGDAHRLFFEGLSKIRKEANNLPIVGKEAKKRNAVQDFGRRCEELKALSLSEICQMIMTEYNEQNNSNRKVKSARDDKRKPDIFQHYKMLLLRTLQEAFAIYIRREEFKFIFDLPKTLYVMKPVEEFLPNWKSGMFDSLVERVKQSPDLQRWYVLCKFLNGRLLNQLSGVIRSYIQFAGDIQRRAKANHNRLYTDNTQRVEYYSNVLEVVDFCIKGTSRFSNVFSDYFRDEDAYADYLDNYLQFKDEKIAEVSSFAALKTFCNEEEVKAGIYMDGENPVMQRNIVMAKLFGPDEVLKNVVPKVTREEIEEYYQLEKQIAPYRQNGYCKSEEDQKKLLRFQRTKNRVEFQTITEFSEIINELLGQLISWSFLRERDLLYFQLGFHYLCLHNDTEKPAEYKEITREDGTVIRNAILHQVAAMYIGGLPVYTLEKERLTAFEKGEADCKLSMSKDTAGAGEKIKDFFRYSKYVLIKDRMLTDQNQKHTIYLAGLELFENTDEHDNITDVRKYVDHFKYYATSDENAMSILDLYSEIHDRFFTYDMKYQKNVANMLENILLRHFVLIRPEFFTGSKKVGEGKKITCKARAQIEIAENGMRSEDFTYKLSDGKKNISTCMIAARNQKYLNTVARLLYYPHEAKKGIVDTREKKYIKKTNRGDSPYNNQKGKRPRKERENGPSEFHDSGFSNTPFAGFNLFGNS